jgi:Holliday junction resolvasome RuvABC ATP-dependent DNA helicase subunit
VIVRVVLIQLKPEFQTYGQRRLIAKKTLDILPNAARVMNVTVNIASDPRTERDWDLCILVRFASMQDPDVYRIDPVHRAYADVFLKPMMDRIHVYHYEEYQADKALSPRR